MNWFNNKIAAYIIVSASFTVTLLGFQNCSRTNFVALSSKTSPAASSIHTTDSISLYIPPCQTDPESAACQSGTSLLGCSFNGQTVEHGQTVRAYQNSSGACNSEIRSCQNGQLSGSFNYASCLFSTPKSCLFNGQTIASGQSVTGFQNSTVAASSTCQSEQRQCVDGVLSGSYTFSSCTKNDYAACQFDGKTIPHGGSVVANLNASGPSCSIEVRTCQDGTLSGSFNFAACTTNAPASCQFNGQTIAHGQTLTAFQTSRVANGKTCQRETRICNDGALSGSFTFAACTVNAPASCQFNGQTIAHGQTLTAFQTSTVANGKICQSETRICNDGSLSGSFTFAGCTVNAPASCQFNGQTIAHGQTLTAFQTSTVANGKTCQSETRICNDGALSGSYTFQSCVVSEPPQLPMELVFSNALHGPATYKFKVGETLYGRVINVSSQAKSCAEIVGYNNGFCSSLSNFQPIAYWNTDGATWVFNSVTSSWSIRMNVGMEFKGNRFKGQWYDPTTKQYSNAIYYQVD